MPLELLLILVGSGIAGIAILLHLMGYSRSPRIDGADHARRIWTEAFPLITATDVLLSEDRSAAAVRTGQGPGVIWAMGSDFVARLLPSDTCHVAERGDQVVIRTADLTAPRIRLRLTKGERPRWFDMLGVPAP